MKLLCTLMIALAAPAVSAGAQDPSATAAPEREARLQAAASYIIPALSADAMIEGVDSGIRQRVSSDRQLLDLERSFPGLGEAIVAGASAEIRRAAPAAIAQVHLRVRRELSERLSDEQLRLFGDYLALPAVAALTRRRVEPGSVDRHIDSSDERRAPPAERAAMRRFERSDQGRAILAIVDSFAPAARTMAGEGAESAGRQAFVAALRAGNAFVAQRFPGRPRPFAVD